MRSTTLFVCVLLAACNKPPPPEPAVAAPKPPPPPSQPLVFESSSFGSIHIKGHRAYINSVPGGTEYIIDVHEAEPGMRISVGGQSATEKDHYIELHLDMRARVRDATLAELKSVVPKDKLLVEIAGDKGELQLQPVDLTNLGSTVRDGVKKGPFLFGDDEPPDAKPNDCLMLIWAHTEVFPPSCKMADVDEVAVVAQAAEPKSTKRCGGYGEYGVGTEALEMSIFDTVVTVYNRRTGAVVETKTLPGGGGCPRSVTVARGQRSITNGVEWPKAIAWAKARVRHK